MVGLRFVQMALQILAEQGKGSASPYAPYIQELPADFTTPLTWTDAELAELQYPYVVQEVRVSSRGSEFPPSASYSSSIARVEPCFAPGRPPTTFSTQSWCFKHGSTNGSTAHRTRRGSNHVRAGRQSGHQQVRGLGLTSSGGGG